MLNRTHHRLSYLVCLVVLIASQQTTPADAAVIVLDDGANEVISSPTGDRFSLQNSSAAVPPTTLTVGGGAGVSAGAALFEHAVEATDDSVVNVLGGVLTGGNASNALLAGGASVINIHGGSLTNDNAFDSAVATFEDATINVFGGTIAGGTGLGARGLDVAGGVANIFGGTIAAQSGDAVEILNGATVNLHGGEIVGNLEFFEGVLNVFGTAFLLDGNPIGPGTLTGGSQNAGALSVTFADSSQTAFFFGGATVDQNQLNLILVERVPEPATGMLVLLGAVTLLGNRRTAV